MFIETLGSILGYVKAKSCW